MATTEVNQTVEDFFHAIEAQGHTLYYSEVYRDRRNMDLPRIAQCDVLYALTPQGHIGPSVLIAATYAYALRKQVVSSEAVLEPRVRPLITKVAAPPMFLACLAADQQHRNDRTWLARGQRIGFSFLGLLAPMSLLLVLELANTWRVQHDGLSQGVSGNWIKAWRGFPGYLMLANLGWLIVGVPFAAIVPTVFVRRRAWPVRILLGASLGPPALYLDFAIFFHRLFSPLNLGTLWPAWLMAGVISAIAFVVYSELLDRHWRRQIMKLTNTIADP